MKFELDEKVLYFAFIVTIYDYSSRYGTYTIEYADGRRQYDIDESDLKKITI